MKPEKLKRCPNVKCKCEAKIIIDKTFTGTVGYRVKSDCGIESGWFKTKQEATDSWNKRPETDLEELMFWWGPTCHTCTQSEMKVAQKLVAKANEIIERRKK